MAVKIVIERRVLPGQERRGEPIRRVVVRKPLPPAKINARKHD